MIIQTIGSDVKPHLRDKRPNRGDPESLLRPLGPHVGPCWWDRNGYMRGRSGPLKLKCGRIGPTRAMPGGMGPKSGRQGIRAAEGRNETRIREIWPVTAALCGQTEAKYTGTTEICRPDRGNSSFRSLHTYLELAIPFSGSTRSDLRDVDAVTSRAHAASQ